ncbi:MAG: Pyrophosphate-energized proton pump [Labilithrix sp.]|nr:Pyrophosphate-energized proton pump [Labilithrix sp.]
MLSRKRAPQGRAAKSRIAIALVAAAGVLITWFLGLPASAQEHMGAAPSTAMTGAAPVHHGGEAALIVPNLGDTSVASFMGGTPGSTLLYGGIGVCVVGMIFAFMIYGQLKNLPVHKSMLEVSELIYATCQTYLVTQIKFILILELFIG